jgi:hypothetical protein
MSIVYRSTKGSKLTSAEVDGNFQHLENLVGGEGNSVIEQTGFALLDQDLTINSGWNWRILGVLYTNPSNVVISIPFATTENHRIDLIVANQSNTFERIAGIESTSNPIAPAIPSNKIAISFITVTDGVVGVPTEPIVGTQFKKKSENLDYSYPILKGTRAVIQLRPEGHSYYSLESSLLVSVDGFGTSLITGNPDAEMPYPMKDLFIHNKGTTPFTLLHNGTGSATSKFFFLDETDLVVPPGGKVWLKYGGTYCQLFLTSWNNGIPTFQQVTDQGNVTDNEITAAAFKNTEGEYLSTQEWVYDKFASKENLRQYNYAFSEPISSIRLELPEKESYLIIDTLINLVKGFSVSFSDLYEGKDYYIYNNSSEEILLKHNFDDTTYDFNFKKGGDIKLPRRGVLHLKFIAGKFIDVTKSWEDFSELQGVNTNKGTYTGGITWTGTTAPSGTTSHSYNWQKAGNLVTLNVTLFYQNSGTALTSVVMDFMNDFPTPVKPDGLTGASEVLYNGSGDLRQTATSSVNLLASCLLRSNSANNGFQLIITQGSISAKIVKITIQYFTA